LVGIDGLRRQPHEPLSVCTLEQHQQVRRALELHRPKDGVLYNLDCGSDNDEHLMVGLVGY